MTQQISSKRLTIKGIVQGVGFRPHVYRLAVSMGLKGWVLNSSKGVFIEVEGPSSQVDQFVSALRQQPPPLAVIRNFEVEELQAQNYHEFTILESVAGPSREVDVSPDIAICADCRREVVTLNDRRYGYPFTNCTNCGPRFTIIHDVPYDRAKTTMAVFPMCPQCEKEYSDPFNRRFHAQPNACPICGPKAWLTDKDGSVCQSSISEVLSQGSILAVKGLGAFHLAVDASNREAVSLLRSRKHRDAKPFAVMARDINAARKYCLVSEQEEAWLTSRQAPIVVMKSLNHPALPGDLLHPGLNTLGLMLPYTPLHYLLFNAEIDLLVMTSANISDEPLITDNDQALSSLGELADYFLLHNREIYNPCDDSVLSCTAAMTTNIIRRARGFVPQGIKLPGIAMDRSVLAVGGEMKNTFCLTRGNQAFLSQHWGDLSNYHNYVNFTAGIERFKNMLAVTPSLIAHDMHPDYQATRWAKGHKQTQQLAVQHHHAHMAAAMAENGLEGKTIGLVLDGSGWGADGSVWGGEILTGDYLGFERVAHLTEMPYPGGDLNAGKPYRMAFIYLYQLLGEAAWHYAQRWLPDLSQLEAEFIINRIQRGEPLLTSSCGRLFDAVSSLLRVCHINRYEGQAAMELEALAAPHAAGSYPVKVYPGGRGLIMDVSSIWLHIIDDIEKGINPAHISMRFHRSLAALFTAAIRQVRDQSGIEQVVLSGGVFHNQILSSQMIDALNGLNMMVYIHRQVPTGDGGIALGQAAIASEVINHVSGSARYNSEQNG